MQTTRECAGQQETLEIPLLCHGLVSHAAAGRPRLQAHLGCKALRQLGSYTSSVEFLPQGTLKN